MDFTKAKITGAVVVGGSTNLATMYSKMPTELAVPVNTLIMGLVGLFIRWVEKKAFKEKIEKEKIEKKDVREMEQTDFYKRARA